MAVTNFKAMQLGREIEIPGFYGEDEMITLRCKRPSILSLAASGLIPNGLLASAQKVFSEEVDESVNFKEIGQIMNTIVKAALVEPTYDELASLGFELTDDQISYVFAFVQGGVKALESFRTIEPSDEDNKSSEDVQPAAIGDIGN